MNPLARGIGLGLSKAAEIIIRLLFALLLITLVVIAIAASLARNEEFTRVVLQDLVPQFSDDLEFGENQGALLSGNFHLESLSYSDQAGSQLQIAGVELQWQPKQLWQKELRVQRLHLASIDYTPAVVVEDTASEPLQLADIELPLSLAVDELSIGRLTVNSGQGDAPLRVNDFSVSIRGDQSEIEVAAFRGQLIQDDVSAAVSADMTLQMTGGWPISGLIEAKASGLPIESIGESSSDEVALQLTLQQSLSQLEFLLQAKVGDGELVADGKLAVLDPDLPANLDLQASNLRFRQADLEITPLVNLQVAGNLTDGWKVTGAASADLINHKASYQVLYLFREIDIDVSSAQLDLNRLLLDVSLPNTAKRTLIVTGSSSVAAPYVASMSLRSHDQIDASFATLKANWSGDINQLPSAAVDLEIADLASWLPTAAGKIQLNGTLSAAGSSSMIKASGEMEGLRWGEHQVAKASVNGSVNLAAGEETNLVVTTSGVNLADTVIDAASIALSGTTDAHTVTAVIDSSQIGLNAELSGGALYSEQGKINGWSGAVGEFVANHPQLGKAQLDKTARIKVNQQQLELRKACLSLEKVERAKLCVDGTLAENGLVSASLSQLRLPLASAAAFVDGLQARGVLTGRGAVSGNLKQLESLIAELSLVVSSGGFSQSGGAGVGEIALFDFNHGDASVSYLDGTFTSSLSLQEKDGGLFSARASSQVEGTDRESLLNSPIDVSLQASDLPLGWLRQGLPDVGELEGQLAVDLSISGTLRQPNPRGEIKVSGSKLTVPLAGLSLKEWLLVARPDGDLFEANLALLADDGGRLDSSLSGNWQAGGAITGSVSGKAFPLYQTADAQIWADPQLKLVYGAELLSVSGEVQVNKALIAPTISLDTGTGAISVSEDQVVVNAQGEAVNPGGGLAIAADVLIKFGDDVQVKAYGLETRLGGRLQVTESPGRLTQARGEITLEDGQYAAFGQPLKIKRGALLYQNTVITQPSLDVTAVREFDDVTVGVNARGTIDEPELELFSTPTLSQSDQLSWLVLGRPFDRESGDSDSDNALARATRALQLQGAEFLTGKLSNRLGIEDVSLESTDDGEGSALVLGKYLSPKLYLSYGLGLFDARNQLKLKYKISRDWSFEAASDGIDSGGNILFHIEK